MWNLLLDELNAWENSGRVATFWWRDDDAVSATSELDQLICVSRHAGLVLAVIPKFADDSLAKKVADSTHVIVAQHGFSHTNQAPRGQGQGAWELGLHRPVRTVIEEMIMGKEILAAKFKDKFLPVMVPPWNRIDDRLYPELLNAGYMGVSAFGAVNEAHGFDGLTVLNCHCDPIKWKGGPRFTGSEKSIAMICEHLRYRRKKRVPIDQPTGLLTHHLEMDEPSWQFVSRLNDIILAHPAATWSEPRTLFNH